MDNLPRKKNKKEVVGVAWWSVASIHHKAEYSPDAGLVPLGVFGRFAVGFFVVLKCYIVQERFL